ncbi:hypothetical protein DPMN_034888 [Dreissena polymorpha]|uniref:Uncharacterized protein n=1 Tax=Dreissena polymorpha TaxID=45954 RepID=A0A9D4M9W5_DREPO|nr:hypothetical protein DPMN_034888 [Dreissena polymorpha]
MKKHREGIEDLSHLLKVDPKNTAAKQEMEVLKNYWVSVGSFRTGNRSFLYFMRLLEMENT